MQDLIGAYAKMPTPCAKLQKVHKFNNFVKAYLIKTFLKQSGNVLDMPCGRGGDLKKFKHNNAGFYCGIDIVPERIEDAKTRYKNINCMFAACFHVADFTTEMDLMHKYDFINCQFALHYAWKNKETAQRVLQTCQERLDDYGYCAFTFPDSQAIKKKLVALKKNQDKFNTLQSLDNITSISIGNENWNMSFKTKDTYEVFVETFDNYLFGLQYNYFQRGSVENIPEYVVQHHAILQLIQDCEFTVVFDENFSFFFNTNEQWQELKKIMGAEGLFYTECVELIQMYRALVIRKVQKRAKKN